MSAHCKALGITTIIKSMAPLRSITRFSFFISAAILSQLCLVSPAISDTLNSQRYTYELAKEAIKRQDETNFQKHYEKLGNYPLKVYLDYQKAAASLSSESNALVESFIRQHKNSYLGDKLHRRYLHHLASTQRWNDLIFWYTPKLSNNATTCRWIEARVRSGNESALAEVTPLWVKPKSLPSDCDNLFALWMQSDHFNDEVVWSRYLLAINASQFRLARYVSTLFKEQAYQRYVELSLELRRNPRKIASYKNFSRHTPETQAIIAYGIKRLAKIAPEEALKHWRRYEAQHIFDLELIADTKSYLATRLIWDGKTDIVEQMLSVSPSLRRPSTIEKLVRTQLKEQRWQNVLSTIDLLPASTQQSKRWQYWKTRAKEQLGEPVFDAYRSLAKSRNYYGFLAADKIGQKYQLDAEPLTYSQESYDRVKQLDDLIRAKELWLTGHYGEAYAEWYYGLRTLSSKEIAAAGALARDWGWHDRAINAMIAGKHWSHLDLRFPLAFQSEFIQASKETKLHPELLFAVARQESAMSEGAISSAGARGLMQLMPATAKQTARKLGIPHKTEDLFDANHNITLGSRYLNELFEKFNGNRILATAAYNAGPHRVAKWRSSQSSELPFDIWIETIPFKETRGYVQNVLTYSVIYSFRMGTPTHLITQTEAKTKL